MTQKEKLIKAHMMACRINSIAMRLEHDAKDYAVVFPLQYVKELKQVSQDFLKAK